MVSESQVCDSFMSYAQRYRVTRCVTSQSSPLIAQDTFKEVMKRDNFEYLGTLPQAPPGSGFLRHHPDTFFHDTMGLDNLVVGYPNYTGIDDRCPLNLSSKVNERFKEARGRHINALVLCEYLSHLCPQQIEVLANVLNPYWRVKVILNYRPIYAWFPSYQNQINAKSTKDIWPDKPHYQGGFPRRLYDLDDDEPTTSRMFHAMARHGKHLAEIVYDNYHQHFDDAEVLPAHVLPQTWGLCEIPILGLLFCGVFDTPQICQAIESGEVKKPDVFQNEAVNDKYSVMADLAYENNRIPRYLTRRRVKSVIRKNYLKLEAGQETPIRCMSNETMERLETFSLSSEQRLFRDHPWAVNATDAARHHADFQRIWKDSRCHVDLKKLMFEPRWLELFRRLER